MDGRDAHRANRDSLARALDQRPALESLQHANISTHHKVAPSLARKAKELERSLIADSLNSQMSVRSTPGQLSEQNVMKAANVSPALRKTKVKLEQAFTRDQLGHLIEQRPAPEEVGHLISHDPTAPVSHRIQGAQRALKHSLTANKVSHLLEKREDMGHLQERNVLQKNMRVAPTLQANKRSLEHNLAKSNLHHALKRRPSYVQVEAMGYFEEPDRAADYDEDDFSDDDYIIHSAEDDDDDGAEDGDQDAPHQGERFREEKDGYNPASHAERQRFQADRRQQAEQEENMTYQRRSRNFHLTRILLKAVASMAEAGEISLLQKGFLKDLIVDQNVTILSVAAEFDADNDYPRFKETLVKLSLRG